VALLSPKRNAPPASTLEVYNVIVGHRSKLSADPAASYPTAVFVSTTRICGLAGNRGERLLIAYV